jgi:hypothetical protein
VDAFAAKEPINSEALDARGSAISLQSICSVFAPPQALYRLMRWRLSFDTIHLVNKALVSFFPDPEPILQLSPEEIAWVILEIVNSWDAERVRQNLAAHNFTSSEALPYTRLRQEVMNVLSEGWAWLQRECLIVPRPGASGEFGILSRKANEIKSRNELEVYRRANLLSGMLHPSIERESKAAFLRGEYETAIFNAFKEVEVRVRKAGSFTANDLGVALMNDAFQVKVGPLTDKNIRTTGAA